jgi:hypothetical protein
MRIGGVLVAVVLGAAVAAGCGGDGARPAHPADVEETRRERAERRQRQARRPPAPTCPPQAANCRAAAGRVIGLESVDPDGDGDLHLILASRTSITLPGITVLDINKDLRPAVDPRIGDWAAGAGPVYSGSYGQSQIQVERVVYDPRRG